MKGHGNDIGLGGETDDEDMEEGETGFDGGSAAVRNIRGQGQPTESERREHMNTHRPSKILVEKIGNMVKASSGKSWLGQKNGQAGRSFGYGAESVRNMRGKEWDQN